MKTFSVLKDPQSVLDYQVDWSTWLSGDTLVASTWTVGEGLINEDESLTTTSTTLWLSDGALNTRADVTNHITTAAGREEDALIHFTMRDDF